MPALCSEPIAITADSQILLGQHCDYLLTTARNLTPADFLEPSRQAAFTPQEKKTFTFGLVNEILWLRFKIDDQTQSPLILGIDRPFPYVTLYVPDSTCLSGSYRAIHTGYLASAPEGGCQKLETGIRFRHPTFNLPKNLDANQYLYLRIQPYSEITHSSLSFVGFIDGKQTFLKRAWMEIAFFALVAGMLLSLAMYNLFLAIQLRDKVYFAYVGYVVFIMFYVLTRSGVGSAFGMPWLNIYAVHTVAIALCFSIIFAKSFLQTKEHCPIFHHLLSICFLACLLTIAAMVTKHPKAGNTLVHIVGSAGVWTAIATGICRLLQGYRPARYYLAGWLTISLGSFTVSIQGFGILPTNFLTTNAVAITCTMEAVLLSLALGARIEGLQEEKKVLQIKEKRLMELSIRDELTGLFNKRWFSGKIHSEIEACKSVNQPLSLIVLDIDHFKRLNDNYGHAMGDKVLNQLGKIIAVNVRDRDIPCRYGGEEFTIILPLIDQKKAVQVAERLRKIMEHFAFRTDSGEKIKATISMGVAELAASDNAASLFERADQALYQAKNKGRNQVRSG